MRAGEETPSSRMRFSNANAKSARRRLSPARTRIAVAEDFGFRSASSTLSAVSCRTRSNRPASPSSPCPEAISLPDCGSTPMASSSDSDMAAIVSNVIPCSEHQSAVTSKRSTGVRSASARS